MSNLRALPVPEVERYVTRSELAALMGVSLNTIDRMRNAGMPSVVWSKRARRFLPSEALRWATGKDRAERGSWAA